MLTDRTFDASNLVIVSRLRSAPGSVNGPGFERTLFRCRLGLSACMPWYYELDPHHRFLGGSTPFGASVAVSVVIIRFVSTK